MPKCIHSPSREQRENQRSSDCQRSEHCTKKTVVVKVFVKHRFNTHCKVSAGSHEPEQLLRHACRAAAGEGAVVRQHPVHLSVDAACYDPGQLL